MNNRFSTNKKSLVFMAAGIICLFLGYVLLAGGGITNPKVFNYDMFDARRMIVAPLVILAGIIIEIVAIMRVGK